MQVHFLKHNLGVSLSFSGAAPKKKRREPHPDDVLREQSPNSRRETGYLRLLCDHFGKGQPGLSINITRLDSSPQSGDEHQKMDLVYRDQYRKPVALASFVRYAEPPTTRSRTSFFRMMDIGRVSEGVEERRGMIEVISHLARLAKADKATVYTESPTLAKILRYKGVALAPPEIIRNQAVDTLMQETAHLAGKARVT